MKKIIIVILILLITIGIFLLVTYKIKLFSNKTESTINSSNSFTSEEVIKGISNELKMSDIENFSCETDEDPNYYIVSWSNPGSGTGGWWYVQKKTGDVYSGIDPKKKHIIFKLKK